MHFWLKISLLLAVVWGVAGGAIYWAKSRQPTAESVAAFVQQRNVEVQSGDARVETIKKMQAMLNRLGFEDRQQLRRQGVIRAFFEKLTPEERMEFLEATLPTGFAQLMESFNRMEPQRRRRVIDRAVAKLKEQEEEPLPRLDEETRQRFVEQGMRAFYNDASADVKLDLTPFIEQLQRNLQGR